MLELTSHSMVARTTVRGDIVELGHLIFPVSSSRLITGRDADFSVYKRITV